MGNCGRAYITKIKRESETVSTLSKRDTEYINKQSLGTTTKRVILIVRRNSSNYLY